MKCPLCKDQELLPCRLTDRSIKPDGFKCPKCDAVFILDGTNHLKRMDGKAEAEAAGEVQAEATDLKKVTHPVSEATHTAALLKPAPVKPETLAEVAKIAEKSLERHEGKRGGRRKLSPQQRRDVEKRLKLGEKVPKLAIEYKVTPEHLYAISKKLGIKRRQPSVKIKKTIINSTTTVAADEPESKPNSSKSEPFKYSARKGNIMSQMARLQRGEIKPSQCRGVLEGYQQVLIYEKGKKKRELKEIDRKLAAIGDVVKGLDIIEQDQKDIVIKALEKIRRSS